MTERTKPNIKQRLSRLLLIALTIACVITSGMEPAFAAEGSLEIETITWKIKGTTLLGTMNYHIREVVAINGVNVNSTSDMDSSYAFCVEPTIVGPEGYGVDNIDTYTAGPKSKGGGGEKIYTFNGDEAADEGYKMMRKLCYYLPSGYGWTKVTKKWYQAYRDSLGGTTNQYNLQSAYALGATVLAKRWGNEGIEEILKYLRWTLDNYCSDKCKINESDSPEMKSEKNRTREFILVLYLDSLIGSALSSSWSNMQFPCKFYSLFKEMITEDYYWLAEDSFVQSMIIKEEYT